MTSITMDMDIITVAGDIVMANFQFGLDQRMHLARGIHKAEQNS
jgi:hypothetical protein